MNPGVHLLGLYFKISDEHTLSSNVRLDREFSHGNLHTHPLIWFVIGREHLASDWFSQLLTGRANR